MKTHFIPILLLFIAMNLHCTGTGNIKVLVIDGYGNHDWSYTTEVVTTLLERSGFCDVDISTAPLNGTPGYYEWRPDFNKYDVVVQISNSLGNDNYWPVTVQKDFEQYMKKGGGMYVFHSANNAFEKWEEYNKMIGLGWRGADQGFAVEIVNGEMVKIPPGERFKTSHGARRILTVEKLMDHPINHGYPPKWMTPDMELYVYARGPAENLQVLSYTYDSVTSRNWPVDWVVEYGKGRVYNATSGHLWHDLRMPESIQCVGFQTTFIRAIQWLSGNKVTYKVPGNFPTASHVSLQPFELVYREKDGWRNIYNGQNLDGWHPECQPADRNKIFWTAKDGYIECNSMGHPGHSYYWLMTDRDYGDFQLRLEFQVFEKSKGNSGVQFRSRYDDYDSTTGTGWLNGPQVDIHPPAPFRTGLIYDETRGVQRWIYPSLPDAGIDPEKAPKEAHQTELVYADENPDAWNTLELICQGTQIRTFINGKRVTRFDATGILDDDTNVKHKVGINGQIGLQLHSGDELLIRFRRLYIRELD